MNAREEKIMKKFKAAKTTFLVFMVIAIVLTVFFAGLTVYFTVMRANIVPTEDNWPWQFASKVQYFFEHYLGIIENFQTICGIVLGAAVIFASIIVACAIAYKYFRRVLNNGDPLCEMSVKGLKGVAAAAILVPVIAIILDYVGLIAEHSIWPDVILHFGRGWGLYVILGLLIAFLVINIVFFIVACVYLNKIKKGKIAPFGASETVEEETEEPATEEVVEEKEEAKEEIKEEVAEEPVKEVAATEEGSTTIGYDRSYMGKLMQTKDETKMYYSAIKNAILSYKGKGKKVSDRISWKYETFNIGRNKVVKMKVKGKTLCVYLALDPKDYENTKYRIENVAGSKADEGTAVMYKVTNARRAKYVLALIAEAMAKFDFAYVEGKTENYVKQLKSKSDKQLVKAGLAKEVAVTSFPRK